MPNTKLSGANKIVFQDAGGDWTAPIATIDEPTIHGETSIEIEENSDTTDPTGNSPHSGQFAVVKVQSSDFAVRATLKGKRTANPEVLVDVRFFLKDPAGADVTITAQKIRAKTMLQAIVAEMGQINGWALESRAFVTDVFDFD